MEEQDNLIPDLIQILTSPERSALPLLLSGESSETRDGKDVAVGTRQHLRDTCQLLFREIEGLNNVYHDVIASKKKDDQVSQLTSLSGLDELYLGDDSAPVDAETLWGQVDLQTNALISILKKSTKSLSKTAEKEDASDRIRLLDMSDDTSFGEEDEQPEDEDDEIESDGDDEEDEETRRIKERMERAMEDMEADEEDEDDDEVEDDEEGLERGDDDNPENQKKNADEELIDPAAEELNDGFFDIDEMEGFADEEEELLPEDAFGTVRPEDEKEEETKPKKSFHQKQREGLMESEDEAEEDEDDDDDEMILPSHNQVRRKKYREDDEIEALYNLYDAPDNDDDDDAVINMTAADFFGRPNKKYLEKHKGKQSKKVTDDDADSWDEQGFDDEGVGWRDEDDEDEDEEGDEHDDDNEDDPIDQDDDEPMENNVETEKDKSKSKSVAKKPLSTDKLQQQIERLEQEMIAEKPWQMTGETKGTSRPVNSLLEASPEFEVASKRAPLITIEHTENLEEVIKRRILAEDWDDVVPRELPDVGWNAKRGELPEVSQEKSKLSLGELYEREYLKKAVGYDVEATEKQTAEEQAKSEIKALFASLCSKLDALSNYHFAPRPVAEEVDLKPVSTPAIAMEEVLPLHVSGASAVAPEEVFGAKRGRDSELKGESEIDQAERKRLRSAKKSARRKNRKDKLADEKLISRLQPGLGLNNPYEKRKMREELSVARSRGKLSTGAMDHEAGFGSVKFFKKMQQEAESTVRGDSDAPNLSKADGTQSKKSSQYKL